MLAPPGPTEPQDDDRRRPRRSGWPVAVVTLVFVALAAVVVLLGLGTHDRWAWLAAIDAHGRASASWAGRHGLDGPLLVVELVFATAGASLITTLLAAVLLARRRIREAVFVVLVMVTQTLLFTALKAAFRRPRPPWQVDDPILTSFSYPSGHATSTTALAGVVLVLLLTLHRRGPARRSLCAAVVAVALLVAADRVLLGRHYPTDVVGGAALGAATTLVLLLALRPGRSGVGSSDQV